MNLLLFKYTRAISLLGLLLFFPLSGNGQATVEKSSEYSYEFSDDGKLRIDNKYGDIEVQGWDQNQVEIDVFIKVKDKSKGDAEELLDRIEAKILHTSEYISIASEIAPKRKGFLNNLFREISFNLDKTNIDIDINVKLPKNAILDIFNEYGDVIITDFEGQLTCVVEHGDMRLNSTVSAADLKVEFGMLDAGALLRGEVDMKNGRLRINKAEDLRINSSGTDIEIDIINSLHLNSNKDEVLIKQINSIQGDVRFSTLDIDALGEHMNLILHISDLTVDEMITKKPDILIDQSGSDIDLSISGSSFDLDAKMEEGQLIVPKDIDTLEKEWLSEEDNLRKINATYGSGEKGLVKIVGKKGTIILRDD